MPKDRAPREPLKPKVFHVLLALSRGPQHGYGIKKSILERTGGSLDLDPGGLYRLVSRLEDDGLLEESPRPAGDPSQDKRRRYYSLTPLGAEALQAEARRLAELASWPEIRDLVRKGGEA
ncbi:MAG: PadR family transcriptional regulator [Gemmatimonadota bacterium]|nr:PadR family transcriptional regulator [Gemmatimonadota bacterium]